MLAPVSTGHEGESAVEGGDAPSLRHVLVEVPAEGRAHRDRLSALGALVDLERRVAVAAADHVTARRVRDLQRAREAQDALA